MTGSTGETRARSPRRPNAPQVTTVSRVIDENERTKTIVLDVSLSAEPGQFAMLWLPGLDEKPFSLMDDDPVAFTIAAVGPFSRAMHRLEEGSRVWIRGPLGRGFKPKVDAEGCHLLVGGGYGVAPLVFLARRAIGTGARTRAVVGARTAEELLLVERLADEGAEVAVTTEDGSAGTEGLVTALVEPILRDDPPGMLYACGPHGMLASLRELCDLHGVAAQLSWEAYMRCGMGLCGSCEHEGRLVCSDGPVLDHEPESPRS